MFGGFVVVLRASGHVRDPPPFPPVDRFCMGPGRTLHGPKTKLTQAGDTSESPWEMGGKRVWGVCGGFPRLQACQEPPPGGQKLHGDMSKFIRSIKRRTRAQVGEEGKWLENVCVSCACMCVRVRACACVRPVRACVRVRASCARASS